MTKILITGVNGYLAGSLQKRFSQESDCAVTLLSVRGEEWKTADFSVYDTVVHCAAIVHQSAKKVSPEEYRVVNTDLAIALAKKAKAEGVRQFVFFSTMGVYGTGSSCYRAVRIQRDQPCCPKSRYAVSKYEAECGILPLASEEFAVSVIRAPFIYGKNAPGNYGRLRKLVFRFRVIPQIPGLHSMIYIETLCDFVRQIVAQRLGGIFTPQNLPIRNAWELSAAIADANGMKVWKTSLLNPLVKLASIIYKPIAQAFGSEYYDEKDSVLPGNKLSQYTLEETVRLTEE